MVRLTQEKQNLSFPREKRALAVEAPRFGKGSGAKEDSSPASDS